MLQARHFLRRGVWSAVAIAGVALVGCGTPSREADPTPSSPAVAASDDMAVAPLRRTGDHLALAVRLNGADAGWFMLDTGAAVNAIGAATARRLGLERIGVTDVTGIAGTERVAVYAADRVAVAGVALGRIPLAELDLAPFNRASGAGVAGVLGFPGLADRAFTLDQAAMTLTLYPPRRPPVVDAPAQPLTPFHNLPSIHVDLGGGRRVRLIIDTGMDSELTLPIEVLRRWPEVAAVPVATAGSATGVGGTITSFRSWVKRVDLFDVTLRDVPTTFETPPPGMSVEPPVGRIGNRLLRHFRLTFDPPRRRIYGEWRPLDP